VLWCLGPSVHHSGRHRRFDESRNLDLDYEANVYRRKILWQAKEELREHETRRVSSAEFQGVDPAAEEAVVAYFREMDI
jgi:hypothetical protein